MGITMTEPHILAMMVTTDQHIQVEQMGGRSHRDPETMGIMELRMTVSPAHILMAAVVETAVDDPRLKVCEIHLVGNTYI